MRKSAAVTVVPKRDQTMIPRPIRTAAAMKVPIAPRLLSHFPTPSPTMLRMVRKASKAAEVIMAKFLLSASPAWPGPSANTETPTK